ncbi:hypothetical protein DXG01_012834 [Tephrocybe rancida]|nr:hypothetical protein DXG01_012834 [Tephrocybe rancida]
MNNILALNSSRQFHRRLEEDTTAATASAESSYAEAEKLRDEEYRRSVRERSQQFEEELEKHAEGEYERRYKFNNLVANCKTTFKAHKEYRDSQYRAISTRWDAAFRVNDATRNAVFDQAERNWALLHQQGQDARDKDVETYEKMRDEYFKGGRQARIALCADLEKALEGQVQDLLLAQERSFILNEDRRNAIMAAIGVEQGSQAPLDTEPENVRHSWYPQTAHPNPGAFPPPPNIGSETDESPAEMTETPAEMTEIKLPALTAQVPLDTAPENVRHSWYSQTAHPNPGAFPRSIKRKIDETPTPMTETELPALTPDIGDRGTPIICSAILPGTRQLPIGIPLLNSGGNNLPHGDHSSIALVDSVFGQSGNYASTSRYTNPGETDILVYLPTTPIAAETPTTVPGGGFDNYAAISKSPITASFTNDSSAGSDKGSGNSISNGYNPQDIFDESFSAAQTRRRNEFLDDEQARKERHATEELVREGAEQDRTNVFTNKMAIWDSKHIREAASFEARFTHSEMKRNGAEYFRHSRFTIRQRLFLCHFQAFLGHFRQSFSMKDKAEIEATRAMRDTLTGLARTEKSFLRRARRERTIRFFTAHQQSLILTAPAHLQRPTHTGGSIFPQTHQIHIINGGTFSVVLGGHYYSVQSNYSPESSRGRNANASQKGGKRPRAGRPPRDSEGRTRSLSPPTGFALRHLFKAVNLQDTLPVPREGPIHEDRSERKRQCIFNQSQAQREIAFVNGTKLRQHGFSVNEAKRQLRFENMQGGRQASFNDSDNKWERQFKKTFRESRFSAAEELRADKFRDAQQSREVQFRLSQEDFDQQFRSMQEELQMKYHEREEGRLRYLEEWATEFIESREREERRLFEMEEIEREELFQQGLRILQIQRTS